MRKTTARTESHPIVKVRSMGAGVALLILLISGPMLTVWKQDRINTTSLQLDSLADSLSIYRKEIAKLQFDCERYASTERIEK